MDPETLTKIREAFGDALELDELDRSALLESLEASQPLVAQGVRDLIAASGLRGVESLVRFDDADLGGSGDARQGPVLAIGECVRTPRGEADVLSVLSNPARFGDTEVYRVRMSGSGDEAVLKILVGGHASRERLRRFRLEAQVQAACRHEHIARLLAAGPTVSHSGVVLPSILMEAVNGEPLDAFAARAGVEAACRSLARAAEAVHHANLRGVIHRDLKPSNILITSDGSPRVLDFGVARLIEDAATDGAASLATQGFAVVGTLAYMAPEQISPISVSADLRADVYALGVMLFEIVFGEPPVQTDGMTVAEAGRAKQADSPRLPAPPGVPRDLAAVATIACSGNPADRHESCAEFAREVGRALDRRPLVRRPPGPARRLGLFVVRRPVAASAIGIALLVALGSLILGLFQQQRVIDQRNLAESRFEAAQGFARWVLFDLSDQISGDPVYRDFQRQLIARARRALADLEIGATSTDALRLDAAAAHIQLSDILIHTLGDSENGHTEIRRARQLLNGIDDPLAVAMRAWCWFRLARASSVPDGETYASMTYAAHRELVALEPSLDDSARYWYWRAWVSCYASRRMIDEERPMGEVRSLLVDAEEAARKAVTLSPGSRRYRATLAESVFWTAHAELDFDGPLLLEATKRAVTAAESLFELDYSEAGLMTVRAESLHARALGQRGHFDQSLTVMGRLLEAAQLHAARDPESKPAFRQIEMLHNWAAEVCLDAIRSGRSDLRGAAVEHAQACLHLHQVRLRRGWVDTKVEGHYLDRYRERLEQISAHAP